MRNYIKAQSPRPVPVGYSSADVAENIEAQALYFACGEDETARSDFFAFNDYSWCDPSDFRTSGWDQKVETYSNYSLPIFLSEFGCITNEREWNEIASLYSDDMTAVYSGGLAYEYTLEANGYGLVDEGSDGKAKPNDDYKRLKAAYKKTPLPRGDGGARRGEREVPECPAESEQWRVGTELLPAMPEEAEKYMKDGAGPGQGIDAETQWAGSPSSTEADLSNGVSGSIKSSNSSSSSDGSGSGDDEEGAASVSSPAIAMSIIVLATAFALSM